MKDYKSIIESEAAKMLQLHEAVHDTVRRREKDRETWQKACEEFHSFVLEIDPLVSRAKSTVRKSRVPLSSGVGYRQNYRFMVW
jgi:hypothetical protein